MATLPSLERRDVVPANQVVRCARQDGSAQEYFLYVPASAGVGAPLFVAVHGVSRNAHELATLFSGLCERYGVVMVAPFFGEDFKDYQRLGRLGRGPRADVALDAIVEEVGTRTGAAATSIHLFGQSAGAQFVHRYTMAHPHRVAGAVIAGAGWYTFPTRSERFPYGIKRCLDLPDVRFDPDEFLQVPITVVVGDKDTGTDNLRRTERVNRRQGRTRVARAQKWVEAMRARAEKHRVESLVTLELIPDGEHHFASLMATGRLGERAFAALFGAGPSPNGRVAP